MTSLKRAAVRGTVWSALSTVFNRGLRFCVTILLARLLVPADFGLIAMTSLVMDVAQLLRDLGIGAAVIQRQRLDPEHLTTCFWTNQAMGVAMWALTVAISPWAAAFYRNAAVQPVLSTLALSFLIAPIGSIPWILLNRELQFKRLMIAETLATASRTSLSLVLAWRGAGVWSLVWGSLAGSVTGSVVNWWFCKWRPSFRWSWRHFQELFRFGRSVFGEKFLGYFAANSDYLVTGRFLGATVLGYYNFAYELPHLAQTHLVPVISRVLFPVFSRLQDDRARLHRGYLEGLRWLAVVSVPFCVGLFVTAPEFVPTVYGAKWAPVIAPLQILCLAGLANALTSTVWTAQQAIGRPDIGFVWNAIGVPLIVGTLLLGARGGILGVATAMLGLTVVRALLIQHITNRLIGLSWSRWWNAVRAPLLAGMGMGGVVASCRMAVIPPTWTTLESLVAMIGVGVGSYGALLLWQDRALVSDLRGLLTNTPDVPSPAVALAGDAPAHGAP